MIVTHDSFLKYVRFSWPLKPITGRILAQTNAEGKIASVGRPNKKMDKTGTWLIVIADESR